MILMDQLEEKAVFAESGTFLRVEKNRKYFGSPEYGYEFSNGEFSGNLDVFPYAVVFYRKSTAPILLGVYEDYNNAKEALKNMVQRIGKSGCAVFKFV